MLLWKFNEKFSRRKKDMQNSYVTLHRTLDTTIQNLESQVAEVNELKGQVVVLKKQLSDKDKKIKEMMSKESQDKRTR